MTLILAIAGWLGLKFLHGMYIQFRPGGIDFDGPDYLPGTTNRTWTYT